MTEELNVECIVCPAAAEVLVGQQKQPLCRDCAERDAWRCCYCGEWEFNEDNVAKVRVQRESGLFGGTFTLDDYHMNCFDEMQSKEKKG